MLALDFDFKDGVSTPELFLVRRPYARIGSSDDSHVLIENLKDLGFEIELIREIGSGIRINAIGHDQSNDLARVFKNYFEGHAQINTGSFTMNVTALDLDLMLKRNEPADKASVRVLRQVAARPALNFPALVFRDKTHVASAISLGAIEEISIGRSVKCTLRVDNLDISGEHASIERHGSEYMVEDLGSTNGTYLNGHRISKKEKAAALDLISLGATTCILIVENQEQYELALKKELDFESESLLRRYPALISSSDLVRPKRFVLPYGSEIAIGRDPDCDIWIGSPSVSRRHCLLNYTGKDLVTIFDESRNGTVTSEKTLEQGESLKVEGVPDVLIFNNEVVLGLCFDEQQEHQFLAARNDLRLYVEQIRTSKNLSLIKNSSTEMQMGHVGKNKKDRALIKTFLLLFGFLGFILFMVLIGSLLWSLWI